METSSRNGLKLIKPDPLINWPHEIPEKLNNHVYQVLNKR